MILPGNGLPVVGSMSGVGSMAEKSPVRNAVSGTFPVALCAWRTDVASKEKKKKALSLRIGPPIVPPYWFRRNGRFGVSLGLK